MARLVKNKILGARVDEVLLAEIIAYIEANDLTMGELVRAATTEYMGQHPASKKVEV